MFDINRSMQCTPETHTHWWSWSKKAQLTFSRKQNCNFNWNIIHMCSLNVSFLKQVMCIIILVKEKWFPIVHPRFLECINHVSTGWGHFQLWQKKWARCDWSVPGERETCIVDRLWFYSAVALQNDSHRAVKFHIDPCWSVYIRLQLCGELQGDACKHACAVVGLSCQHLIVVTLEWRWARRGSFSSLVCSESWRPACVGEPQSLRGTPACPGESGMPRSWLWTGCTCGTALASTRLRTASRATGGRDWTRVSESLSGHCEDTSCTGGRLRRPSLWLRDRTHLERECVSESILSVLNIKSQEIIGAYQYLRNLSDTDTSFRSQNLSRIRHLFYESSKIRTRFFFKSPSSKMWILSVDSASICVTMQNNAGVLSAVEGMCICVNL